jgi:hypothetical protein
MTRSRNRGKVAQKTTSAVNKETVKYDNKSKSEINKILSAVEKAGRTSSVVDLIRKGQIDAAMHLTVKTINDAGMKFASGDILGAGIALNNIYNPTSQIMKDIPENSLRVKEKSVKESKPHDKTGAPPTHVHVKKGQPYADRQGFVPQKGKSSKPALKSSVPQIYGAPVPNPSVASSSKGLLGKSHASSGSAAGINYPVSVNWQAPSIRTTKAKDGSMMCVISGRDYVADIVGSEGYVVYSLKMNPGLSSVFAWLSGFARKYSMFKWTQLEAVLESLLATAVSGDWFMNAEYNVTSPIPASVREFVSNATTRSQKVYLPIFLYPMNTGAMNEALERHYVRTMDLINAEDDIKTYDPALLRIAFDDLDPSLTGVTLGRLYMQYSCEFYIPHTDDRQDASEDTWMVRYENDTGLEPFNIFDPADLQTSEDFPLGDLDLLATNANQLIFPTPGYYQLCLMWFGEDPGAELFVVDYGEGTTALVETTNVLMLESSERPGPPVVQVTASANIYDVFVENADQVVMFAVGGGIITRMGIGVSRGTTILAPQPVNGFEAIEMFSDKRPMKRVLGTANEMRYVSAKETSPNNSSLRLVELLDCKGRPIHGGKHARRITEIVPGGEKKSTASSDTWQDVEAKSGPDHGTSKLIAIPLTDLKPAKPPGDEGKKPERSERLSTTSRPVVR